MSLKLNSVYIVPAQMLSDKNNPNNHHRTATKTKTVAIVAPQRSNSLDYLNFEEKRQLIASSLSLSDFLRVGDANKEIKDVKETTTVTTLIVAKKQNGTAFRTNSLGSCPRTPPLERKSKFSALGKLFKPWKWKRKKKSDKLEAVSRTLERKISVRANRDELVQKGILLPDSPIAPISEPNKQFPSSPLPLAPAGTDSVPGGQTPQATPLGAPPAYPSSIPPLSSHNAIQHALLQQQLLQNPQFVQATNANAEKANNHQYQFTAVSGKSIFFFLSIFISFLSKDRKAFAFYRKIRFQFRTSKLSNKSLETVAVRDEMNNLSIHLKVSQFKYQFLIYIINSY
ncbi:uncharacterized protein LOC108744931 isoform X1 [Agrilus planipennis]|uniref:Uncharacterized protein LOC108744931 isoform X1 n=1 Tax=Agrilus planipennis TaxID=224129 RepID=A0A1W4XK96_AGRPL|nr:uncharacterized protein LOC108744931 isoform X1 [Agrilus planipennis]